VGAVGVLHQKGPTQFKNPISPPKKKEKLQKIPPPPPLKDRERKKEK